MAGDTDLAWAAGFFDGEGCIRSRIYKGKRHATHCQFILTVSQAESELLYQFQAIFNKGVVNGPYKNSGKGVYHYRVSGTSAVSIIKLMWPYLGQRKKRDFIEARKNRNKFYEERNGSIAH